MYVCADDDHCPGVLPTSNSWAYYADTKSTCTRSWVKMPGASNTYGWGQIRCVASTDSGLGASVTLPQRSKGNYFVTTNGTGTQYRINICFNTIANAIK